MACKDMKYTAPGIKKGDKKTWRHTSGKIWVTILGYNTESNTYTVAPTKYAHEESSWLGAFDDECAEIFNVCPVDIVHQTTGLLLSNPIVVD